LAGFVTLCLLGWCLDDYFHAQIEVDYRTECAH
jgi:hypothetical protein